jgi:hypothetical protein
LFARVGWFYRYEAYLVGFGWTASALALSSLLPLQRELTPLRRFALAFALLALAGYTAVGLARRGNAAMRLTPQASQNIYEQQYQTARFVSRYYPDSTILANDIGAVAFYSDVFIIDVLGLATRHTAAYQLAGVPLNGEQLAEYAEETGARIAILYDSLYMDGERNTLPLTWHRLARWSVRDNVAAGDATVSIYATNEREIEPLRANLLDFSDELPMSVIQQGEYLR